MADEKKKERPGALFVSAPDANLDYAWGVVCRRRGMPSLMVTTLAKGRARVTLDLSTAGRCFTEAGLSAVVALYQRHGSRDLARAIERRHLMEPRRFAFGHVKLAEAGMLTAELLAILATAGMTERSDHGH